jgi:fructoselysine-6-P-deglycase FrlB-like protein
MRVVVVYRQNTDYTRAVETFVNDFTRQTGRTLESIDPDSLEGITFCTTYDIIEYPSVIALSHDGQVQNTWKGAMLPTISEVSYYATQD